MYMTDILVAVVAFMNLANGILLFILIRSLKSISADQHVDQGEETYLSASEEMSIQDHVVQREEAYAARIERMREEMAFQNIRPQTSPDSQALELHPDVHNLPHNIIHAGTQIVETSE